jgi:hypothetical protein
MITCDDGRVIQKNQHSKQCAAGVAEESAAVSNLESAEKAIVPPLIHAEYAVIAKKTLGREDAKNHC